MSASVDGVGGVGGVGDGRGPIGRSRLSEFSFAGGDRGIQDDLVREVMWRAAQVAVYDRIDAKIAEFDAGISDILSELLYVHMFALRGLLPTLLDCCLVS